MIYVKEKWYEEEYLGTDESTVAHARFGFASESEESTVTALPLIYNEFIGDSHLDDYKKLDGRVFSVIQTYNVATTWYPTYSINNSTVATTQIWIKQILLFQQLPWYEDTRMMSVYLLKEVQL